MNVKKYPPTDPHFAEKVRGACRNDFERGMVYILLASGMHVSNLVARHRGKPLDPVIMTYDGDLRWDRVKTYRPMKARVPHGDRDLVRWWLKKFPRRRSERSIQYHIKEIGRRSGFPDLSPTSFRVWRACKLLDEGVPPHEVRHLIGCSMNVLMDNYAQLKDDRRVEELSKLSTSRIGLEKDHEDKEDANEDRDGGDTTYVPPPEPTL